MSTISQQVTTRHQQTDVHENITKQDRNNITAPQKKHSLGTVCKSILLERLNIVSMIRKCHNHKLQITPWHREEEPLNHHEAPGRQIKQSNQLSLPHQDDCNTKMDIK